MEYYVYILFNHRNGTLYVGVTNNLVRRIYEHKNKIIKGFSSKYNIDKLGYLEVHNYIEEAIKREKQIKAWQRKWKLELIEKDNPDWNDLYNDIVK